jgi:hypothetical protein
MAPGNLKAKKRQCTLSISLPCEYSLSHFIASAIMNFLGTVIGSNPIANNACSNRHGIQANKRGVPCPLAVR